MLEIRTTGPCALCSVRNRLHWLYKHPRTGICYRSSARSFRSVPELTPVRDNNYFFDGGYGSSQKDLLAKTVKALSG